MNKHARKAALAAGMCLSLIGISTSQALAAPAEFYASQQVKKVSGVIIDASGIPVIGANVLEKGTTNGVITDLDGNFTLNVKPGATLVITYIGYVSQEIEIGNQTTFKITLKEDSEMLDEVVVVGYGTMKKSDLSGASVSMDEDAIKGSVITNLDQSLQGRAAGVAAVSTSGAPGSASSIRVRGQATINSNAEPLYVIDGVIVQGGGQSGSDFGLGDALGNGSVSTISPLSTINPQDIVSMEILKDASATAIYGAQGANGVILITTKRGKTGEAKFTYDGMVAVQRQTKRLDIMNLREFADFYNDFVDVGELDFSNIYGDPSLLGVGTNWQDAIFRTALQHQHQVSAQGGSEKVKYYVSGSYMDQDGTLIGSSFNRYSFRTNLDAELKPWLKIGLNATYSSTKDDLKLADSEQGIINYSLTTPPDIPIYDIDGNYSSVIREGYTSPNPIALALMDQILLYRQKLTGSIFADVTLMKNLTWHAEFGYDISYSKGERYEPRVDLGNWKRDSNMSSIQKNNSTFWQLKNYVTYTGQIDKHGFTAMVGQEMWASNYDNTSIQNTNLASDAVHNPALGAGTPSINSGFGSSSMASFFTRLTYNYDDRYLGTYTYRYDGSSNFGPENRWAGFHAVAASWRFSNENFFEPIRNVINNGKLRLGWGQTGNSNIGGYRWGASISRMPTGLGLGYRQSNIANPGVKWETQEQVNVALDLGFFNDRIGLTVDWYKKVSKDMLMSLQLPSYMGTSGNASSVLAAPMGNYGDIENTGWEISLNTHPLIGEFQWDSDFQISFNRNKLRALDGTANAQIVGYGQWSDVVSVSEVGESLYNFYGYVCDGVYEDLRDLQTSPKPAKYPANGVFNRTNTVWVGDIKYKDLNGDGIIDENDRTNIGSPLPKFTFGWNNTFRYKNFDLGINMRSWIGFDVYNTWPMYLGIQGANGAGQWNLWKPALSDERYNKIRGVKQLCDYFLEDGSFLKIDAITLGYTMSLKKYTKDLVDQVRIYATVGNVATITGYSGYNPEVNITGWTGGVDKVWNCDPMVRTYTLGIQVAF